MIPKRRQRARFGIRRETRIRCPGHLQFVRLHVCAAESGHCNGRVQAAHVRSGTDGGLGIKPSDCFTIPLCEYHHEEQHTCGEAEFEQRYQINMKRIAMQLWNSSSHRLKYERKQQAESI